MWFELKAWFQGLPWRLLGRAVTTCGEYGCIVRTSMWPDHLLHCHSSGDD